MELYDPHLKRQAKTEAIKRLPWGYNIEAKHGRVPTDKEIASKIVEISQFDHHMAAFLAALYLTGSRLHEILPYTYKGVARGEITIEKHGLRIKDIYGEEDQQGVRWVYIVARVQKSFKSQKDMSLEDREQILRQTIYRKPVILYAADDPLYPILQVLDSYLDQFSSASPDTELFTFSRRKADRFMNQYLQVSPHNFRNWRATNLQRYYGFSASDLKAFFMWRGSEMPLRYASSDEEIIKKRLKGEI